MYQVNRDNIIKIKWAAENLIPAAIRDNRYFAKLLYFIVLGKKGKYYLDFYQNFLHMSSSQISEIYASIYKDGHPSNWESDLTKPCLKRIESEIIGPKIIDIGCGNGFLLNRLIGIYPDYHFVGTDFHDRSSESLNKKIEYKSINLEKVLPFPDKSFDTVICTHVLEHILNFQQLMLELRRITSKKLIIVVPQERPYKYNFGMHIHFFPYKEDFIYRVGKRKNQNISEVGGDLYYTEEYI